MKRLTALVTLLLFVTGCAARQTTSHPITPTTQTPTPAVAQPVPPTPPAAQPPSTPAPPAPKIEPGPPIRGVLWPAPGTSVFTLEEGREPRLTTKAYAPFTFKDRTLHPVLLGDRVYFLRQETDAAHLDGWVSDAGLIQIPEQPLVLWRLPIEAGATFELRWEHHNFGMGPLEYLVLKTAEIATSEGTRLAMWAESDRIPAGGWFAEGLGLVRPDAMKVVRGEPEPLPQVKTLHDGTTAILSGGLAILDQEGRPLAERPINYMRSGVHWINVGATDPIVLWYTHSQAEPHLIFEAMAYNPADRRFEPVRWRNADGTVKLSIAGDSSEPPTNGPFRFRDDERYPLTTCTYSWRDGLMDCIQAEEQIVTDERLFAGLINRPLDEISFSRLFVDPELGRRIWKATRQPGYAEKGTTATEQELNRSALQYRYPEKQADGSWLVGGYGPRVRYTLVRHGEGWRIATCEIE